MALPRQSRKHQVALQPRKVRLRLVQLAPCMIPSAEVGAGATVLTLTFMPPGIGPQQLWVLDTGSRAEVVAIQSVNLAASQVTLTSPTTNAHKPGKEWVALMPVGTSREKVFGKWFFASWAGLNGNRGQGGWLEGEYLRQMIEEGTGQISLPNATGSDGMKHYDRFLITTLDNYRVGDEWIEIWAMSTSHAAGDLLFVGSPNQAKISETEIKLGLVDGYYLLKKQRESNAGFWNNGPRDVFEEYTKQMQVLCADGFDTPSNFPSSPVNHAETSDQRWEASNTIPSPVASKVRILPRGATDSFLRYKEGLKIGTNDEVSSPWGRSQETHENTQRRWRLETNFTVPAGEVPQLALELVPAAWTYGGPDTISLRFAPTGGTLKSGSVEQAIQKSSANSALFGAGNHTFAIEGRGRWVFFYADGVLLGVLPTPAPNQELFPQVTFYAEAATPTGYGSNYVDIDYMLMRYAVPMLMRSVTDKGDYRLPGSPSGSGLKGEYFSDTDISSDAQMGRKQLAPLRQPYATRVDTALNFAPGVEWWPAGVIESQNFSVRWTGAIYLDLSNFDYSLFTEGYAGCRLWIGRTRWNENIIERWQNTGHGNEWFLGNGATGHIQNIKGTALSPGPLYGQESGWFPIMIEYQMGNASSLSTPPKPNISLTYIRSDVNVEVPVNVGAYAHTVVTDNPWWYWPLDNPGFTAAAITAPVVSSANPSGIGGGLPPGTYRYVVTALDANGETIASNEVTATVGPTSQPVQVSWTEVPGATRGYRVYRSPNGGAAGSENIYNATAAEAKVTLYNDIGGGTPGSPPPAAGIFFFNSIFGGGGFKGWLGNTPVAESTQGPVPNDQTLQLPGETTTVTKYAHQPEGVFNTTGWTAITIEAWINPTEAVLAVGQVIVEQPGIFSLYLTSTGKLFGFVGNGTLSAQVESAEVMPSGVWTHVAITYDGTNARLYVNGVLKATSGTVTGCFGTTAFQGGLGYYTPGGVGAREKYQFKGGIAHVAIYKNNALSAARLLAHAESVHTAVFLNGGTMQAVSNVPLSPQGFFSQQVRSESHYELIRSFAEEWGLQWTCRPMSLESGEFPGRMCPRLKEGRQTDYVIDHSNVISPQVTILADDTADTLLVDAQGLADTTGAGQLQAEVFNFFEIAAHALTNTEYDSPGDIQVLQQLLTRADSLLALRAAPWSELEAQARGKRTLTDTWPLSGVLAEFPWLPGEGVRCLLPGIGVEDSSTRQLWGMKWTIYPDGLGAPSPVFKQRPRSVKEAIRKVITALRSKTLNYQGQFAITDGSLGGRSYSEGAYSAVGAAPDGFSRLTLPPNLSKIKAAYLSVQTLVATNMTWTLWINSVSTGIVVKTAGTINILPYVSRDTEATQRMYAILEGASTGSAPHSGNYTIKLELQVII